jgi:hypothetical protein
MPLIQERRGLHAAYTRQHFVLVYRQRMRTGGTFKTRRPYHAFLPSIRSAASWKSAFVTELAISL